MTMQEEEECLLPRESSDGPSLLNKPEAKRWYLLALFSTVAFFQAVMWNTWGPISTSASFVFNWQDSTIALLSSWGAVGGCISFPLFTWMLPTKGLRWSCLLATALGTLGSAVRCVSSFRPHQATVLFHTGQLLNAFGGGLWGGAIPLFSSVWFPAHQRNTATAVSLTVNGLGLSASFLAGPLIVPDVNATLCPNATTEQANLSASCLEHKKEISSHIMILLYSECAVMGLLFLVMLLYFPAKPKLSPSLSAAVDRIDLKQSFKLLSRNCQFWLLSVMMSMAGGVYMAWSSVLNIILDPLSISQFSAAWLGFWGTFVGQLSAVGVGLCADCFSKRLKLILLVTNIIGTVASMLFCLQVVSVIPPYIALLYLVNILLGIACYGSGPPCFESISEVTFPVSEGVSNGIMFGMSNVVQFAFLMIFFVPNIGVSWVSWSLLGSGLLSIVLVLFYQEKYIRLDIDLGVVQI